MMMLIEALSNQLI